MTSPKDRILRAMTDDASFRVVTVDSRTTVSGVLAMQSAKGSTARQLADLTTGMLLIRETMSPSLRVQGILKRAEPAGYILADANPNGQNRGLVSLGESPDEFSLDGAIMQVMRSMHNGQMQQGVVQVKQGSDVAGALMTYMQESEQITTMLALSSVVTDGQLKAGGYLIQLLPGAQRGALAIMTERLEDFRNIDSLVKHEDFSAASLLEEIFYGMPHTELGDSEVQAGCWCSHSTMLGAIASVGKSDIESMIRDGKVLEINCDYCTREYRVTPAELQGLTRSN